MKKLRAMDLRSAWVIAVASGGSVDGDRGDGRADDGAAGDSAGHRREYRSDDLDHGWLHTALAALLLPAGALGDRLGRREVLIVGLIIFGVASLAAIWCTDPVSMIISRAAWWVGAALIMPTTLSLITTGVPADKRELGISIWAAVVGAGAIFGILITGVLRGSSWKSIFIMFAVMAVTILVLSLTIATSRTPIRVRSTSSAH